MSTNVTWVGGDTDGNKAANYNPARVPTTGDVTYLDGTSNLDCILTGNLSCDGINLAVGGSYSGTFDPDTFDVTLADDLIFDKGKLFMGGGAWEVGGNCDLLSESADNYSQDTATLTLTGSGKLWNWINGRGPWALVVAAGASITQSADVNSRCDGGVTINGSLEIADGSIQSRGPATGGSFAFGAGGSLSGAGYAIFYPVSWGQGSGEGITAFPAGASMTISEFLFMPGFPATDSVLVAGTYNPTLFTLRNTTLNNRSLTLDAGTYTFGAAFELEATSTGDLTLDLATNNPTVTVSGPFTVDINSTGGVTFAIGTADVTFHGDWINERSGAGPLVVTSTGGKIVLGSTSDQAFDSCGAELPDVEIDKAAGTVTLGAALACASLTLVDGDLDFGGKTVDVTGLIDFQSGSTVTGLGDAVLNCDTFTAEVDLTSVGGYSDDVPDALSGQSLEFDGADDWIDVGDADEFSFGDGATDQAFSVSFWIKLDNINRAQAVFGKYLATGREYACQVVSGRVYCFVYDHSAVGYRGRYATISGHWGNNEWVLITWVYDGGGLTSSTKIYFDAAQQDDGNVAGGSYVAMEPAASPLIIGDDGSGTLTRGYIDDFRLYDSALSAGNITTLAAGGDVAGAVGHWKFDGSLLDETANDNDGTLYGGAGAWEINASSSGSSVTNATIRNLTFNGPGGEELDATVACVNGGNCSGVDFGGATGPLVNGGLVNAGLVNGGLVGA